MKKDKVRTIGEKSGKSKSLWSEIGDKYIIHSQAKFEGLEVVETNIWLSKVRKLGYGHEFGYGYRYGHGIRHLWKTRIQTR